MSIVEGLGSWLEDTLSGSTDGSGAYWCTGPAPGGPAGRRGGSELPELRGEHGLRAGAARDCC